MKRLLAGLLLVLLAGTANAADVYVGQTSAGSANGSSAANRLAYASLNWATLTNDRVCVVGTIASNFSVGAHNSTTMAYVDGSCDSTDQGNISVASGNALTIPAATSRNKTTIQHISVISGSGSGIRLEATAGVTSAGRHFTDVVSSNNGTNGVFFQCDANNSVFSDIDFVDSQFNGNNGYGIFCDVATSVTVTFDAFTLVNSQANDNGTGTGSFSGVRISANSGAGPALLFTGAWVVTDNQINDNDHVGWRVVDFQLIHNNADLKFTDNEARRNGRSTGSTGGGGFLISGYGDGGGYSEFGGAAGNDCYIADNIAEDNDGPNSGFNFFSLDGCVIERNVSTGSSTSGSVIDGNGFIMDQETDNTLFQFNNCEDQQGSTAENSGACLMILGDDNVVARYNWGTNSKTCLWVSENNGGSTLSNIQVYNNTFTNCKSWGVRHLTGFTDATQIHVKNNIFRGDGSSVGYRNDDATNADANYNIFYNFSTNYTSQTAGANDLTTDPLLIDTATDFRLQSTSSPAYNSGTSQSYTGLDPNGIQVPQATTVDRGAFELEASTGFPTITDYVATPLATNTSHAITQPTCAVGKTSVYRVAFPASTTITEPATYTLLGTEGGTGQTTGRYYHKWTGSETGTVTFTTGTSNAGLAAAYCVTGAADPAVYPPEVGTAVDLTTANPNSGSLTASWGSANNLFCSTVAYDVDNNVTNPVTVYPTNYTLYQHNEQTATFTRAIAMACREVAGATDDPGAYTITTADDSRSNAIVFKPEASVPDAPFILRVAHHMRQML